MFDSLLPLVRVLVRVTRDQHVALECPRDLRSRSSCSCSQPGPCRPAPAAWPPRGPIFREGSVVSLKVAVVCVTLDVGLRQIAEDAAASQLAGARAVPSYRALRGADLNDLGSGGGGARTARISRHARDAHRRRRQTRKPRAVRRVRLLRFECRSDCRVSGPAGGRHTRGQRSSGALPERKLIWSGVSRTFDAASANADMAHVSKAVAKSIPERPPCSLSGCEPADSCAAVSWTQCDLTGTSVSSIGYAAPSGAEVVRGARRLRGDLRAEHPTENIESHHPFGRALRSLPWFCGSPYPGGRC